MDRIILRDDWMKKRDKAYKLWIIALRNDHDIFSLCLRNPGSGMTDKQRVSLLITKIFTIMAVHAFFYGQGKSNQSGIGDYTNLFWISFFCTLPPLVFMTLFKKYKRNIRLNDKGYYFFSFLCVCVSFKVLFFPKFVAIFVFENLSYFSMQIWIL